MKYRIREKNELKPSGVEWLGDIPKDWIKTNLVNFLKSSIVDGPHETPEYQDNGIPFISVDSLDENEFVNLDVVRKFISEEQYLNYNNKTKLAKNDLLFTKSATIGKVAIMDDRRFMTWSPIAIIKSHPQKIFFKYLFYILKSNRYVEYIKSLSSFNTQLNIGMRVLEKSQISAPKYLIEQQKIANFLDEKSKIFDEAISKKEQLISKLELAKQSLISEVVTGKLKIVEQNSKLQTIKREQNELKPSGVEWLGDIPKDWQIKKLKYISEIISSNVDKKSYEGQEKVLLCNYVDVYKNDFITNKINFMEATASESEIKKFSLQLGDILITKDSESPSDIAIPTYVIEEFENVLCGYHLAILRNNKNEVYSKYLYRFFQLIGVRNYFETMAKGVTRYGLSLDAFKNIFVPNFYLEEQQKISKYLDEKLIHFDNTIEKTKQSITKLKEAKEALISQAVTGKIEVL